MDFPGTGWNLPPGVGNNHPIFDDGPEYDTDELDSIVGRIEEAMGDIEEGIDILISEGYFKKEEKAKLLEDIDSVKEELDYFSSQQKADW